MKRLMYMILFPVLTVFPMTLPAQTEKPVVAKVEEPAPAKPEKRSASRAHVDARECLQLSTNMEIHRCSLKYR